MGLTQPRPDAAKEEEVKTIVELLQKGNGWVVVGPVRLLWDADCMAWAVYERKRGSFRDTEIIITQDERRAVEAFAKAAGLDEDADAAPQ